MGADIQYELAKKEKLKVEHMEHIIKPEADFKEEEVEDVIFVDKIDR